METMEFLSFPVSSIRKSIKGIDDSYRNPWDILAELAQNSVDAIHHMQQNNEENGVIDIEINAQDKSICFEDNGCGISKERLPELLKLFSSGKDGDSASVGEKGVGLKFVYFQSNYFEIVSSDGNSGGRAIIKDARVWKNASSNDLLTLDFEEVNNIPRGTKIILKKLELPDDNDDQATSIFKLSIDQIKFVLRSKTFLGDTKCLWETNGNPITINLKYVNYNGETYSEKLDNRCILPTEELDAKDIVDLDAFEKWLHERDRSDDDKRRKLQGKVIVAKGSYDHNGYRRISYWCCFLPSRRTWERINKEAKLIPQDEKVSTEWQDNHSYCMFKAGIYTATKGMPTGISIDRPSHTGTSGYWENIFMLFQDNALSFDIGRKSIHGKTQAIYQAKAKELFQKITGYVTKYTEASAEEIIIPTYFDKFAIRDQIGRLVDLSSDKVVFKKNPLEQEAAVSALFFELIGNGTISDIEPIYLGYRQRYDLYANYISLTGTRRFCFMEFKARLRSIVKDYSEARKMFDEMDYIICWDVCDQDIQELYEFGINCQEVQQGTLQTLDVPKSVTHIMTMPNCNPVYVIDIKELL